MYRQAMAARRIARVPQLAARRYATEPPRPVVPPPPSPANARPVVPVVTVGAHVPGSVKPVVVTPAGTTVSRLDAAATVPPAVPPPPPPQSELPPPPPPPPPRAPRRLFRKLLLYTAIGTLIFYPASGLASLHYPRYRDFFTSTFPLAEQVTDYAEDNNWDQLSVRSVTSGAKQIPQKSQELVERVKDAASGVSSSASSEADKAKAKAGELKREASKRVDGLSTEARNAVDRAGDKAAELRSKAGSKLEGLKRDAAGTVDSVKREAADLQAKAGDALDSAKHKAEGALDSARHRAGDLVDSARGKTAEAVETVKDKTAEAKAQLPKFSEGVAHLVDEAERALGHAKQDAISASPAVAAAGQAQYPDTLPPRGVKAETPSSSKSSNPKQLYTGPALPIGFEPPPGYYVPKPVDPISTKPSVAEQSPVKAEPPLPLLAPIVKDFAAEEPIISQLASTIDNLASSLSATSSAATSTHAPTSPESILGKARDDLSSLSTRLASLKEHEKSELERTVRDKTAEFEKELQAREGEWRNKEGELQAGWQEEKGKLIDGWRKVLDRELEGQRTGIEQRLREEVIAQGIELQRRWLRSIKAQVESERGGRLAKLDNLTSSFKQLERITIDNSSQLDANVSLHTLWSALRAVQAKADRGSVAFDDELSVLKNTATAHVAAGDKEAANVIQTMIESIEQSGAAVEGVKSLPSLSGWFSNTLLPKIQSVSLVPAEHEAGVLSHVASALLSKVLFTRKAGFVQGDDVGAVLARAEYYLGQKDLDMAAREINQLQGWAGKLASDWLREARKRLAVEQALQVVAMEATLSSLLLV